jgi:hypothetical protein
MLPLLLFPATLCTALFAGAALYINVAEHLRVCAETCVSRWRNGRRVTNARRGCRRRWPRSDLSLPSLPGYRERARGGSLLAS